MASEEGSQAGVCLGRLSRVVRSHEPSQLWEPGSYVSGSTSAPCRQESFPEPLLHSEGVRRKARMAGLTTGQMFPHVEVSTSLPHGSQGVSYLGCG